MADYSLFGKNLKRIMNEKNIDRISMAYMSGVSANMISAYRTQRCYPTSRVIQDIADALGVDVGEFFKEEGI